jgi:hypothetical protein
MGRPTKVVVQQELEEKRARTIEDFARALPGIVDLPFKAVASRRGDHWLLDSDSRGALCQSIKGMMLAYMPLDMGQYLPIIMFGVVLTGVVSARYVEDVRLSVKRKREASERPHSTSGPGRGPGLMAKSDAPAA